MKETQPHNLPTQGTSVTVPHLAETLVSATIGRWLKQPGDYVKEFEVLCELLTEKINVEMPCPVEGTLREILVKEGVAADVGQAICIIDEPENSTEAKKISSDTDSVDSSISAFVGVEVGAETEIEDERDLSMRNRYSPSVLKLAAERGITLSQVIGTGLGGRITRKDVEHYIEPAVNQGDHVEGKSSPPLRTTGLHLSENPSIPRFEVDNTQQSDRRNEYYMDVTPIRNTIANKMRQSVAEIPHAWTMIEVDVTNLVILRNKWKDEFIRKEGINLTYLAFLLKAVVSAIKDYPMMNSFWGVDKIIVKRDINISLAVGTEELVITPVIKKADEKNIAGLAREIDDLTKKARSGKLQLSDLQGGTFTVNNTGSFGSILSYPIINYPQAAILTFESIVKRPVVIQDMIAVRSMVNLCLSLDHRILDGVICGRFLQRVKENLESFNQDTKLY